MTRSLQNSMLTSSALGRAGIDANRYVAYRFDPGNAKKLPTHHVMGVGGYVSNTIDARSPFRLFGTIEDRRFHDPNVSQEVIEWSAKPMHLTGYPDTKTSVSVLQDCRLQVVREFLETDGVYAGQYDLTTPQGDGIAFDVITRVKETHHFVAGVYDMIDKKFLSTDLKAEGSPKGSFGVVLDSPGVKLLQDRRPGSLSSFIPGHQTKIRARHPFDSFDDLPGDPAKVTLDLANQFFAYHGFQLGGVDDVVAIMALP